MQSEYFGAYKTVTRASRELEPKQDSQVRRGAGIGHNDSSSRRARKSNAPMDRNMIAEV